MGTERQIASTHLLTIKQPSQLQWTHIMQVVLLNIIILQLSDASHYWDQWIQELYRTALWLLYAFRSPLFLFFFCFVRSIRLMRHIWFTAYRWLTVSKRSGIYCWTIFDNRDISSYKRWNQFREGQSHGIDTKSSQKLHLFYTSFDFW